MTFLYDGRVPIDNNAAKSQIRPSAVGKKNWMFVGGKTTGLSISIIHNMFESAKRHANDPEV